MVSAASSGHSGLLWPQRYCVALVAVYAVEAINIVEAFEAAEAVEAVEADTTSSFQKYKKVAYLRYVTNMYNHPKLMCGLKYGLGGQGGRLGFFVGEKEVPYSALYRFSAKVRANSKLKNLEHFSYQQGF